MLHRCRPGPLTRRNTRRRRGRGVRARGLQQAWFSIAFPTAFVLVNAMGSADPDIRKELIGKAGISASIQISVYLLGF